MCGFFGVNRNISLSDPRSILNHRGPDAFGEFKGDNWYIANNRLAIVDLNERSNLPFVFGDFILAYNGEVYNFREIRQELEDDGYYFQTDSDSEVVIKAYAHWKEGCLERFNGMFAICILNRTSGELFLARDHFGIKPLFYAQHHNLFYFASEIKALFHMGVPRQPDINTILKYLVNGQYHHDETSFFKDVYSLLPGHYLVLRQGKTSLTRWYQLPSVERACDEHEAIEEFNRLLENSIEIRSNPDVALCLTLSGGLDSSSILHRISKSAHFSKVEDIYHWNCEGFLDEMPHARSIAGYYGRDINVTTLRKDCFFDYLNKCIKAMEQPFGGLNTATALTTFEAMAVRRSRVILMGDGSDEILAGYSHHIQAYRQGQMDYTSQPVQSATNPYRRNVVKSAFVKDVPGVSLMRYFDDPLKDSMYNDLAGSKLRRSLLHQDLNAMSQSVEARFPFLDHGLVEYCYSLPGDILVKNGFGKYVLRESNREKQYSWVRKRPIQTPQSLWLKRDLYDPMCDSILNNHRLFDILPLNYDAVHHVLDDWNRQTFDNSFFVWQLVMLDSWSRVWF